MSVSPFFCVIRICTIYEQLVCQTLRYKNAESLDQEVELDYPVLRLVFHVDTNEKTGRSRGEILRRSRSLLAVLGNQREVSDEFVFLDDEKVIAVRLDQPEIVKSPHE
jgi:hypothetical protein